MELNGKSALEEYLISDKIWTISFSPHFFKLDIPIIFLGNLIDDQLHQPDDKKKES